MCRTAGWFRGSGCLKLAIRRRYGLIREGGKYMSHHSMKGHNLCPFIFLPMGGRDGHSSTPGINISLRVWVSLIS